MQATFILYLGEVLWGESWKPPFFSPRAGAPVPRRPLPSPRASTSCQQRGETHFPKGKNVLIRFSYPAVGGKSRATVFSLSSSSVHAEGGWCLSAGLPFSVQRKRQALCQPPFSRLRVNLRRSVRAFRVRMSLPAASPGPPVPLPKATTAKQLDYFSGTCFQVNKKHI